MSILEGEEVQYQGRDEDLLGDRGDVLVVDSSYSHVIWRTGLRAGRTSYERNIDLASVRSIENDGSYADALDVHSIYEASGAAGLVDFLYDEGRLDSVVSLDVRNEPSLQGVLAKLTPVQRQNFIEVLTRALFMREHNAS